MMNDALGESIETIIFHGDLEKNEPIRGGITKYSFYTERHDFVQALQTTNIHAVKLLN